MDPNTEFMLSLSEASEHRRIANERIAEGVRRLKMAEQLNAESRGHRFSIVRAIQAMSAEGGGGLQSGIEAEVCREYAHQAGKPYDRNRVLVPFGALMGERTLTVGSAAGGGYLTSNLDVTIGEALRGYSVAFDAGLSSLSGLKSNVQVAQESTSPTGYWVAELGTATASAPLFDGVQLSPKVAGGYVEISGRLLQQAPGVDAFVGRSLSRQIGQLVDDALINGTGTDAPLGITGMAGVTTTTGTLTYAKLLDEEEAIANAFVNEANHKWIGSPDVRALLSERSRGTGGGYFWDGGKVLGKPAYATPAVGTQSMVHGDLSQALLALWGPNAFQLEVNPYANFKAGVVGVRVLISCDLALLNTGAVRVYSAIT